MSGIKSPRPRFVNVSGALALPPCCAPVLPAQSGSSQSVGGTPEQRSARYFESIRKSPPLQLKTMSRTSLQYAFLSGDSLWADARKFVPVSQCAKDISMTKELSSGCKRYLATSEKARLQWKLEEEFKSFESQF